MYCMTLATSDTDDAFMKHHLYFPASSMCCVQKMLLIQMPRDLSSSCVWHLYKWHCDALMSMAALDTANPETVAKELIAEVAGQETTLREVETVLRPQVPIELVSAGLFKPVVIPCSFASASG